MPKTNFKQATKRSIYESKVNSLDNLGTNFDQFVKEEGLTVIENVLGDFVERIHDNINKEKNFVTTGKINDISIQAEGNAVNVYAHKHLIYQDRGVSGTDKKRPNTPHSYTDKMPPVNVFKEWIKEKNIRLVNNHKYRGENSPFQKMTKEDQIESAAWGMAMKVFKEGFPGRNIYSKEIPKLIDDLKEEVGNFVVQSIIQYIDVKPPAKRVILPK